MKGLPPLMQFKLFVQMKLKLKLPGQPFSVVPLENGNLSKNVNLDLQLDFLQFLVQLLFHLQAHQYKVFQFIVPMTLQVLTIIKEMVELLMLKNKLIIATLAMLSLDFQYEQTA